MHANTRPIALALQGGGSHGAFTWGVLDRLLEESSVDVQAVSGASAGAVNAALLASGWQHGGRPGAQKTLRSFWETLGQNAGLTSSADADLRVLRGMRHLLRWFSPYQINPLDLNPLRILCEAHIEFEALRRRPPFPLYVATTVVSSGALKVFPAEELTADVLMASTCLPQLHRSVEIDGVHYWDGGLAANPPLLPLLELEGVEELVLVLLEPLRVSPPPTDADEIGERMAEIAFSAGLRGELRAIAWMQRWAARGLEFASPLTKRVRRLRLSVIAAPELLEGYPALSRVSTHPELIEALYQAGRNAAQSWLSGGGRPAAETASFDLDGLLHNT